MAHLVLASIVCAIALPPVASCQQPSVPARELAHEAYVWQRAWTGAVRAAVAGAPEELSGLRVLVAERDDATGALAWPAVQTAALVRAGRPVTAVVRLNGSRPVTGLSLGPVLAQLGQWRAAGVLVVGLEIDHDCATAALADYASWLRRQRPPKELRWSITALPTWAASPELADVAAAVDELVLQLHAVRAPELFEAGRALAWVRQYAQVLGGRAFRVALPTYRVTVGGQRLAADPAEVASVVRALERAELPGFAGIVWFRLPVAGDAATWQVATLRAVIAGAPLRSEVKATLVARGAGLVDVVVHNRGTVDVQWPELVVRGQVEAVDLVGRYHRSEGTRHRWHARSGLLLAGERAVVGWARGQELSIDAL